LTTPREGERYVVRTSFEAIVLTHWRAPFTGGGERMLPEGLELIVNGEPPPEASAVNCSPTDEARWLADLVDAGDAQAEKFAGYSISVPLTQLSAQCEKLGD